MPHPDPSRRRALRGLLAAPAWAGVVLGALGAGCANPSAVPAPTGA
ncbi:MAG: hypothetical protein ACK50I_25465 [Burkholderiales bacterium]